MSSSAAATPAPDPAPRSAREAASPTCLICDGTGPFRVLYRPPEGPAVLVRCPRCGLVFQHPQPAEDVLRASYYHDAQFTHLLFGDLREVTLRRARDKLPLLRRVGHPRPGAAVLDVGASSGAWMEVAGAGGMHAQGVEVGEATAAAARARGLRVRSGTLWQAFAPDATERFDLITFWDVLEHLRDPRVELQHARGLLAPGGVVAATFPNVDGWYPRTTKRLLTPLTGVWEYPELPVHLYDFAPATARALFARAGLRVVQMATFPTPFEHYRSTALSLERLGRGNRARLTRLAFESLRVIVYPAAQRCDRSNSLFVAAVAA